jgi:hypothetical protein
LIQFRRDSYAAVFDGIIEEETNFLPCTSLGRCLRQRRRICFPFGNAGPAPTWLTRWQSSARPMSAICSTTHEWIETTPKPFASGKVAYPRGFMAPITSELSMACSTKASILSSFRLELEGLLLLLYLAIDRDDDRPLIIDQPEDLIQNRFSMSWFRDSVEPGFAGKLSWSLTTQT